MEKSLYDLRMEYWDQLYRNWSLKEVFSFPWFFNVAVLLVFYIVWVRLVDKRRLKDILLFGSLIAVAAGFIDIVAVTTGLWEYKVRLLPISPAIFPFDYTVVPILYMLVLQYTSSWRNYLIGSVIASGIFAFIISAIYIYVGIKQYHRFNHFYMFAVVFTVTTIIKAIYNWINNIECSKNVDKTK